MSLKKNVTYSSILTISGYLFPLITFPYVSRVLRVDNIGICNFIDSIIEYFILFSMMGVGTIATREIAKNKNDKEALSKSFSSLLILNLIMTSIALIALFIVTNCVTQLSNHKEMMYIGAAKVLFNSLLIEWLYKGLEDFKYITLRSIFVKCLYVISIFVFIRQANDYILYFALTSLMVVINAIINIVHSQKLVYFSLAGINFLPYIKSFFILGAYHFLTSMYTSFNVAYLGFVCGEKEVGYYSTAVKLFTLILSFFSAFTGVMMPHMSALIAEKKMDEFKRLTNKSIDALLVFAMPLIVISEIFAPEIIRIIAGSGYEGAIIPMRIVMPLIFIIGYEQIIVIQMLMPLKKDRAILYNSVLGASIALILNILLISNMKSVGSAIVWGVSELAVLSSAQYFINKYASFKFPAKQVLSRIVLSIPIILINILLVICVKSAWISLLIGTICTYFYYALVEIKWFKNELILNNVTLLINKFGIHK